MLASVISNICTILPQCAAPLRLTKDSKGLTAKPMAARNTPSKGGKPDKLMRDAIIIALKRAADEGKGTKLTKVAEKLVDNALAGDMQAIKEVNDRVDGRAPQSVDMNHGMSGELSDLLREINGKSRGLPKG